MQSVPGAMPGRFPFAIEGKAVQGSCQRPEQNVFTTRVGAMSLQLKLYALHAVAETMDMAVPPAPAAILLYKLHVTPAGEPAQPVSHAQRSCKIFGPVIRKCQRSAILQSASLLY